MAILHKRTGDSVGLAFEAQVYKKGPKSGTLPSRMSTIHLLVRPRRCGALKYGQVSRYCVTICHSPRLTRSFASVRFGPSIFPSNEDHSVRADVSRHSLASPRSPLITARTPRTMFASWIALPSVSTGLNWCGDNRLSTSDA